MKYIIWVDMAVVSLVMLMGGVMKLTGNSMATASFATLGFPRFFVTFIGICEISGAIGIWLRKTSMLAAIGIALIMVDAVYYHVIHTPIAEVIPALVVLACCAPIISHKGTGIIG